MDIDDDAGAREEEWFQQQHQRKHRQDWGCGEQYSRRTCQRERGKRREEDDDLMYELAEQAEG